MDDPHKRPDLAARNRACRNGAFLYEDPDWMRDAYLVRQLSLRQMATEAECGLRTIARWMENHQIPTRDMATAAQLLDRSGSNGSRWKGGRPTCSCGKVISWRSKSCNACRDRSGLMGSNWRGPKIGYAGAHDRVKSVRGSARTHVCKCGIAAREWAYDGLGGRARVQPES
jgi:hypothetical protein